MEICRAISVKPGRIFGRMHLHSKLNYPLDWNRSPASVLIEAHRCQRCGKRDEFPHWKRR